MTWDDRIPDPDNPKQPRQIDVTIRRPESFAIVECRIHKDPQDVQWIEELIGRRASLRADTVIAVSNSGFTEGAKSKATHFGVILRDFHTLTQEEIRNWGKQLKVQLNFYEFTNNVMTFVLPEQPTMPMRIADYRGDAVNWRGMFETVMTRVHNDSQTNKVLGIDGANAHCDMDFDAPIFVNGTRVIRTMLTCNIRRVTREVLLSSVVAYADPTDTDLLPQAMVGSFDLGASEIVDASDTVSIVADLSQIEIPANCLFHGIFYDFGRVVEMRGMHFVGCHDAMRLQNTIQFRFGTLQTSASGND